MLKFNIKNSKISDLDVDRFRKSDSKSDELQKTLSDLCF